MAKTAAECLELGGQSVFAGKASSFV